VAALDSLLELNGIPSLALKLIKSTSAVMQMKATVEHLLIEC
jgi:hypothetical protein